MHAPAPTCPDLRRVTLGAIAAIGVACSDSTGPTLKLPVSATAALAAGMGFSCALNVTGAASCWGANDHGQLGDGGSTASAVPVQVQTTRVFSAIDAWGLTTCALDAGGLPWCWGQMPGDGMSSPAVRFPTQSGTPPEALVSISVGYGFVCGLAAAGAAYCWGLNESGQLGTGDSLQHNSPTLVSGGHTFAQVASGVFHACGVTTGGAVYCWGNGVFGQLGQNPRPMSVSGLLVPTRVATSASFKAISAGTVSTCGLTSAGAARCWGANWFAQLGDGTQTGHDTPTVAAPGLTFATLRSANGNNVYAGHTCGVATGGSVYCWGRNAAGQTGGPADGTCGRDSGPCNLAPLQVAGVSGALAIALGYDHSCALLDVASVVCWGGNGSGQLGDGTTVGRATPAVVHGSIHFPP